MKKVYDKNELNFALIWIGIYVVLASIGDKVAAVSRSPPRGSKHLWFSLVSFPRGFPTRLSHRAVPRAHVVGVDPRLERQGSAGKTGSSGMD